MTQRSLQLEDHVLRLAEHHLALREYLDRHVVSRQAAWSMGINHVAAHVAFKDNVTSQVLLQCPAFALAGHRDTDNQFRWSVPHSPFVPFSVRARWQDLEQKSLCEDRVEFTKSPFVLTEPRKNAALALTAAGALDCYTCYTPPDYGGGLAFIAIDAPPEVVMPSADAWCKLTVICSMSTMLEFNKHDAITAYLGKSSPAAGDVVEFDLVGVRVQIGFDKQDRIVSVGITTDTDEFVEQSIPELTKPHLFQRLLGEPVQ